MTSAVRQNLIKDLEGKTIRVHDLGSLLPGWSEAVSPDIERLRNQIEAKLDTLFIGSRRAKLKAVDPAWFAASWWPYAGFEQLWIATWLSLWLFAWDDEIDSTELSTRSRDFESLESFRSRTLKFVRQSLGFAVAEQNEALRQPESDPLITSFGVVGEAMMTTSTLEQRQRLLEQVEFFLKMSAAEQTVTLGDSLPTVEQYLRRRLGTSAVRVCFALTDYCYGMQLPPSVMQSEAMERLSDESNIIISTINDILSVHKEIALLAAYLSAKQEHGQTDTLIPLLFHEYKNVQTATEVGLAMVKTSVNNFEKAAGSLLQSVAGDDALTQDVGRFIEGCKYACTANSSWSSSDLVYDADETGPIVYVARDTVLGTHVLMD